VEITDKQKCKKKPDLGQQVFVAREIRNICWSQNTIFLQKQIVVIEHL
jgi:hypothetical protein